MSVSRWIAGSIVLGVLTPIVASVIDSRDVVHASVVASERRGPAKSGTWPSDRARRVIDLLEGRAEASKLVDDGPGIAFIKRTSTSSPRPETATRESPPRASASSAAAIPSVRGVASAHVEPNAAPKPLKFRLAIEVDRIVGDATTIGPVVRDLVKQVSERCGVEHGLAGDRLALRLQIVGDVQRATVALSSLGDGPDEDDVIAAACVERIAKESTWPSISGRTVVIARIRYIAALTSAADVFLKAP